MRSVILRLANALLLAICLLNFGAARPSAAQPAELLTIDFENKPDGALIGESIAGLRFTSKAGQPWLIGDVRSGNYNAPHPAQCPAFGGQCAYAVSGHSFAWIGASSNSGTIEFTDYPATQVDISLSTAGMLTITAYDPDGKALDVQKVAANTRTGRLDSVSFAAPAIASLTIEGAENGWVMDNLRVGIPQVGPPTIGGVLPALNKPAKISVVQHLSTTAVVEPGAALTLTIVATNHGPGRATNVLISVPLSLGKLHVLDTSFSSSDAWVSDIHTNTLQIQTGPIFSRGDSITATLHLMLASSVQKGQALGERLSFTWFDSASGGIGRSNMQQLVVGEPRPSVVAPLILVDSLPSKVQMATGIFAPNEPVGVWYHTPAGQVIALPDILVADNDGAITIAISTPGLPSGSYVLVASGLWSKLNASGVFTIP